MFFDNSSDSDEPSNMHTLHSVKHSLIIDSCKESLFEGTDRTDSPVFVELPYPIHKPLKTSEDLVSKMIKEKEKYNKIVHSRKRRYMKYDKVRVNEHEYSGHKYMYIPKYVIDYYDEEEPEDIYKGDYNHYYTGGNLAHFQHNNFDYLARPDLHNNLCINRVPNMNVIDDVVQTNYTSDSIIYGIRSEKTSDGPYLVLREKNKVTAVRCDNVGTVTKKYSRAYKQPIFDAMISEDFKLGVVFSNMKFSVRDMETDTSLYSFKNELDTDVDNFQQFRFLDNQTVVLMSRSTVHILDVRTQSVSGSFKPKLLPCNPMYNFVIIGNDLILASRHYLYRADIRDFEDTSYYSHFIKNAPCYIDFTIKGCDTYLTVCGQSYDNRALFTGDSPYSLPYDIPNLKETLVQTKLKHPPLVLQDYLDPKVEHCLTGCKILTVNENVCLYTSNCFGEIFQQNVYEEQPDTYEPVTRMYEWSKTVENPKATLHATNFEQVSDIKFSLDAPVAKEKSSQKHPAKNKEEKFLEKFEEKYSTQNVNSEFAKDFLNVWEDSEEEVAIETIPKEQSSQRTKNWVDLHNFGHPDLGQHSKQ
ncbi:uncharacterized protein LOC114332195 [Diabrotica virgifera virgifera]|uniref:Uncharacterized protein LOC114332195 n=1 Tax=Diabrotica virgifera virgifera TaxID=50390 RepID=A0A6P7FN57_DIAVI|nr:uncharacterized protein LOC114332195 [Diabrotica virgifera virgifera]